MADDKNLISSETHEINYVLKKWDKKQSKKNRQILRDTLDKFRDDTAYKPHNRENFYRYVKDHDILELLEDTDEKKKTAKKAEKKSHMPDLDNNDLTVDDPFLHKVKKSKKQKISIHDLTLQRNTPGTKMKLDKKPGNLTGGKLSEGKLSIENLTGGKLSGGKSSEGKVSIENLTGGKLSGGKSSKKNLIIALIIILAIILIIILILAGTCLLQGNQTGKNNDSPTEDVTEQIPVQENPPEENTESEKPRYTAATLISFLETCTPLYFIGDRDELETNEDSKIDSLVSYLENYTFVDLSIEGHTADIGEPADEMALSIMRAELIARILKEKVIKPELKIKTTGYGALRAAVKDPDETMIHLNRRVEIKIIDALSD